MESIEKSQAIAGRDEGGGGDGVRPAGDAARRCKAGRCRLNH